jgi:hypothetical protein
MADPSAARRRRIGRASTCRATSLSSGRRCGVFRSTRRCVGMTSGIGRRRGCAFTMRRRSRSTHRDSWGWCRWLGVFSMAGSISGMRYVGLLGAARCGCVAATRSGPTRSAQIGRSGATATGSLGVGVRPCRRRRIKSCSSECRDAPTPPMPVLLEVRPVAA